MEYNTLPINFDLHLRRLASKTSLGNKFIINGFGDREPFKVFDIVSHPIQINLEEITITELNAFFTTTINSIEETVNKQPNYVFGKIELIVGEPYKYFMSFIKKKKKSPIRHIYIKYTAYN